MRKPVTANEERIDEIVRQGKSDYFTTKGNYENPYKSGTAEHNAYERGWMQSLKRVSKPFPGGSGKAGSYSLADRYRNMPGWRGPGDDQD